MISINLKNNFASKTTLGVLVLLLIFTFKGYSQNKLDSLGRKQGSWKLNKNDTTITCNFINDSINGEVFKFVNEQIVVYQNFKLGIKDGIQKIYWTNTRIKEISYFDNGQLCYQFLINQKGKPIMEIHYKNNVKDGRELWYYPNGKLWRMIPYEKGKINGSCYNYRKNGSIYLIERYVDDKFESLETF